MKHASKILWLVVVVMVLVAVGSVFVFRRVTEHTEIRNSSGQTVTDVVLELRDTQTDWSVTKRVATLKPGESVRVRHTHRDTKAVVTFAVAGRSFRHDEGYIDLWTGEGWRFDIQPGGVVTSGYAYRESH
jgi:hypothetical protein